MNCKTWKKLLAVLLTLATVLSMSMAAFATGGSVHDSCHSQLECNRL